MKIAQKNPTVATNSPNMKPPIWKRPAPWILLSIPALLWLFGLGAFWSIRDRVVDAEYPLPWPLMRVNWPEEYIRIPGNPWPVRYPPIPPGHYSPLIGGCANVVRVRPNSVHYYAQDCNLQLATPLLVALGLDEKEVKIVEWPRSSSSP